MSGLMRTRVKICGVRDARTARVCVEAGADAVGLVFASRSPRSVGVDEAKTVAGAVGAFVTAVGLFVDEDPETVARVCGACGLGMVQLHGAESPETCTRVGELTALPVLRAVRFDPETIDDTIVAYHGACDALLVDGSSGGHGVAFDWSALASRVEIAPMPIVVAGGLTPENAGACVGACRPYAVDVSSGVESSRGVKDAGRIAAFCDAVRRADAVSPHS